MDDDEVNQIAAIARIRNYDRKVFLINTGETEQYLNLIVKGLVRKFFNKGSSEIITQIAREGEFISSSVSFLTGKPSEYCVETLEPCTFLSFSRQDIEKLYTVSSRFQQLGRIIITNLMLEKETWELDRIRYSTQERFARFLSENAELFNRVPQKFLASYLHIQPETFSRLKHTLRNPSI